MGLLRFTSVELRKVKERAEEREQGQDQGAHWGYWDPAPPSSIRLPATPFLSRLSLIPPPPQLPPQLPPHPHAILTADKI